MTKDNAERVNNMIGKFVERVEKQGMPIPSWVEAMLHGYVLVLVNKAERRGAKKERKSRRPCIHCPACGRLIALIPLPEMNRESQPPFDVEKVEEIIRRLKHFERRAYSNDDDCGDLFHACFCGEVVDLLRELGIDE